METIGAIILIITLIIAIIHSNRKVKNEDENGQIENEWHNKDIDKPFSTDYYSDKQIECEHYDKNDKSHRDKPVSIHYYNGTQQIEYERYDRDGDKPFLIYYYKNGQIKSEHYNRFRDNAAFIWYYVSIWYYKDGQIKFEEYYKNGIKLTDEEVKTLKLIEKRKAILKKIK